MATLRDVAEQAGVSLATASRVVSGLDNVRYETRERVERAMRELLYVPPGRRPATGWTPKRTSTPRSRSRRVSSATGCWAWATAMP